MDAEVNSSSTGDPVIPTAASGVPQNAFRRTWSLDMDSEERQKSRKESRACEAAEKFLGVILDQLLCRWSIW
jgi:hypothetical protein